MRNHYSTPEERELGRKWKCKRHHVTEHHGDDGTKFLLSFSEYRDLARLAGITAYDITNTGHHLARIGDTGNYEIGNCRFIPYLDNLKERKTSAAMIAASKTNVQLSRNCRLHQEKIKNACNLLA
jgi:hypothetical protein